MLKKFVSSLLAAIVLVGCGQSSAQVNPDTQAKSIVESLELTDKMDEVQDRVIKGVLFLDDTMISDASLYIANDSTADLVGVFTVQDGQMDAVKEKLEDYLSTTKSQMESYYPDEVFKIDNAVMENNDDTIILIVTNDIESAKSLAQDALN